MHKFFERLLEGKDPAEALATLKEIMIEYFGFGSSIELEELTLILGQIADDYNEDGPELDELEEELDEEKEELQDQLDILKKEVERIKREQQPVAPAQPYKKTPWVGSLVVDLPPGDFDKYKYTMRSDAAEHLKSSGVDVTPELFQTYVSSLASSPKQQ